MKKTMQQHILNQLFNNYDKGKVLQAAREK